MQLIQYYEHSCLCGCDGKIEIKEYHKYKGIPKYINGHSPKNYKHGDANLRLYGIYYGIKKRCYNLKHEYYYNYGGRGITICPEWTNDYTKFRDWALSNGYEENLVIDRINSDGNYEPSNCRWITKKENNRNRNFNKLNLEIAFEIRDLYNSKKNTKKELSKKYGVTESNINYVLTNKIWYEPKINMVKCLDCQTILISRSRHDFQSCKCPNGTFVDGGNDYLRFGGKELAKIGFWDEEEQKYKPIKISDTITEDEQLNLF